jgi:hypothetical protein
VQSVLSLPGSLHAPHPTFVMVLSEE